MSYKYKVSAVSRVGDADRNSNEYYFADGMSSVENGMCASASADQECLGRKHIFAIASEPNNVSKICDLLSDSLSKPDSGKYRIKIQYELKEMMDDIKENQCSGNEAADMSMIYIEGGNVYAAGFGQINIYRYNKEKSRAEKVIFPSAAILPEAENESDGSDTPAVKREPSRSKFISALKSGDRYLILGSELACELGDDAILEALSSSDDSAIRQLAQNADANSASSNHSAVYFKIKKSSKKLVIAALAVILAAALAIAAWNLLPSSDGEPTEDNPGENQIAEVSDTVEEQNVPEASDNVPAENEKSDSAQLPLEPLTEQLNQLASGITGDNAIVAYYVKNLSSGDTIQSNAYSMSSASLNNLFVMAEVYRQAVESAIIIDDSVSADLNSMITMGDNDATNRLISLLGGGDASLGFKRVTEFAVTLGCNNTQHNSDLQTISVDNVVIGNYTSVGDCGIILEKMYKGELVNEESSQKMLELLKTQQRRTKIPKYLPEGLPIANKTGETDTVQNDVAVVYSEKADYVVCIMVNNYANTMDEASDVVARMSEAVYKYINQ